MANLSSDSVTESNSALDNSPDINSPLYGVDWSSRAHPASHCWFPVISKDLLKTRTCAIPSCTQASLAQQSKCVQCEVCTLVMHEYHLHDSKASTNDALPFCRPSFVNNATATNSLPDAMKNMPKHDEHFWLHVSELECACLECELDSTAPSFPGCGAIELPLPPQLNPINKAATRTNTKPGNCSPKASQSTSGLICLWCSRSYHRSCWENLADQHEKISCDYGLFQNIIVRPQWLIRSNETKIGLKARVSSDLASNDSKSNAFPFTPVLAFINKRSGGQVGEKIYRELLRRLNPRQVFLLENNDTITNALEVYSSLPNVRVCVFGGDGTVGWILSRLAETYPSTNNPPVSICPLGTGNDLSRVLAWGEQYDPKSLFKTLLRTSDSKVVVLDRWQVELEGMDRTTSTSPKQQNRWSNFKIDRIFASLQKHPKFIQEANRDLYENFQKLPNTRFINYMSFGLDAAIALDFHDERTRNPSKFSSPFKNKIMYLNQTCKYFDDFARANMWNLGNYIRLICDEQDITDSVQNCHTLVILNIPGYASGTNPWGKTSSTGNTEAQEDDSKPKNDEKQTCELNFFPGNIINSITKRSSRNFEKQNFGDQMLEVVALSTAHMATIHAGFHGQRIAQCSQLRVELATPMTAQMDGEPFYLGAAVAINISHAGQVLVLQNENRS